MVGGASLDVPACPGERSGGRAAREVPPPDTVPVVGSSPRSSTHPEEAFSGFIAGLRAVRCVVALPRDTCQYRCVGRLASLALAPALCALRVFFPGLRFIAGLHVAPGRGALTRLTNEDVPRDAARSHKESARCGQPFNSPGSERRGNPVVPDRGVAPLGITTENFAGLLRAPVAVSGIDRNRSEPVGDWFEPEGRGESPVI